MSKINKSVGSHANVQRCTSVLGRRNVCLCCTVDVSMEVDVDHSFNVSIEVDVDHSTLSTTVTDSGVYSCQAVNDAGKSDVRSCNVTAVQPGTRSFCTVPVFSLSVLRGSCTRIGIGGILRNPRDFRVDGIQICRSSLLSLRVLSSVSRSEYADGTDRQTDRLTD